MRNQVPEPENLDKRENGETKTVTGEWWVNIYIKKLDYKDKAKM